MFPEEEFISRRRKVFDRMEPNALAILPGNIRMGEFPPFRQAKEFYYLCGIEVPNSYLLLDGRDRRTILYLPKRDPQRERSEGPSLSSDDPEPARELTGVKVEGGLISESLFDQFAQEIRKRSPGAEAEEREDLFIFAWRRHVRYSRV